MVASPLHVAGVGNDPRYTPTTPRNLPLPEGLTPNIPAADYAAHPRAVAIAEAAKALNDAREAWLNPPELVGACRKKQRARWCRDIPTASCRSAQAAETLKDPHPDQALQRTPRLAGRPPWRPRPRRRRRLWLA